MSTMCGSSTPMNRIYNVFILFQLPNYYRAELAGVAQLG